LKIPTKAEIESKPGDENRFLTLKELAALTEECYQTWRIRVVNRKELPFMDISDKASSKRRPRIRVSDYKAWWRKKMKDMEEPLENNSGD